MRYDITSLRPAVVTTAPASTALEAPRRLPSWIRRPAVAVAAVAQTPAATKVPKPGNGVACTFNAEKYGLELKFLAKPSASLLERLKASGWRWSRFGKLWYHSKPARALSAAADIAGMTADETATLAKRIDGEATRRADAGMERACGIA